MEDSRKFFKKLGFSDNEIETLHQKVSLIPDQKPGGKLIARAKWMKASFDELRPDEKKLALATIASVACPIALGLILRASQHLSKQHSYR